MIPIDTITNYILSMSEEDVGDGISNLKLQKLLYYCQGTYLAIKGTPLFEHPIEAWEHGPVVPEVYHQYKEHGSGQYSPSHGSRFDPCKFQQRGERDSR